MTDRKLLLDEHLESVGTDYDREALVAAEAATYVLEQDVCYEYTAPITDLRQRLVILPRRHHGDQRRVADRFSVQAAGTNVVRRRTDRFGNPVVEVTAAEVQQHIRFQARAVIKRIKALDEPPSWSTPQPTTTRLTTSDTAMREAVAQFGPSDDVVDIADSIAGIIHRSFTYRHGVTSVRTTAAEAWHARHGVCQDMAHVMIAMCSSLGVAARYVSGHLIGTGASHAWVEVFDHRRGAVVSIDPTHNRRTDLRYVTTAVGRDYRDIAPTAGSYTAAGARGHLSIRKQVRVAHLDQP